MTEREVTEGLLTVHLEDAATRSMWVSMLGLLRPADPAVALRRAAAGGREPGVQQRHLRRPLQLGDPADRSDHAAEEAWAPGMQQALAELQREIEADDWVEVGVGEQPWEHQYRRRSAA